MADVVADVQGEVQEVLDLAAKMDAQTDAQAALLRYGQRMQEARQVVGGKFPGFNRESFPLFAGPEAPSQTQMEELKAKLAQDMGLTEPPQAREAPKEPEAALVRRLDPEDGVMRTFEEIKARHSSGRSDNVAAWRYWCRVCTEKKEALGRLRPTFGYEADLSSRPLFARFDVRDEVCLKVGGFRHGQVVRDSIGREFTVVGVKPDAGARALWLQPHALGRRGAGTFQGGLQAKLAPAGPTFQKLVEASIGDFDAAEASDGEEVPLCRHCGLPLGETPYRHGGGRTGRVVHAECLAQLMLQDIKEEQDGRLAKEGEKKRERRIQYDIGWQVVRVPKNLGPLGKLGFKDLSARGAACCVVLDEANNTVRLAPTLEPAASINLEYLSIALKVRLAEGREPLFSLDPVNPEDDKSMQAKVFEPAWLAGTSVGEVMFQADYHLKELSMGEYDQPIVGMKSAFDHSELESDKQWHGREWFVVRKAEIHYTDDNVVIPFVKMGVEAREQILKGGQLEDVAATRASHPLVRYAEAFTHSFDLIAERKSVIYHLRELAKASVLAKFLLGSGLHLDSSWFELAGEAASDAGVMEIPCLWNDRLSSRMEVKDGKLPDSNGFCQTIVRNVCGGVDFGLDRFGGIGGGRGGAMGSLAARLGPRAAARVGPMGRAPSLAFGGHARSVTQSLSGFGGLRAGGITSPAGSLRAVAGPSGIFSGRTAMAPRLGGFAPRLTGFATGVLPGVTAPQGVDLNLDRFSLSEGKRVAAQAVGGSWGGEYEASDDLAIISTAFWSTLDGRSSAKVFAEEDQRLLREIFNPCLSDRREDGEHFIPPDTSSSYASRLRCLVKEEEGARNRRKDHFTSLKFEMCNAGPLFPSSWTSEFEIAQGRTPKKALAPASAGGVLKPRPEYLKDQTMFDDVLKSATPIFDMLTEDGIRWRIYRCGSLEIRTMQAVGEAEGVAAAFSIGRAGEAPSGKKVRDEEGVVKVTQYVERAARDGEAAHHGYLVFETAEGGRVVVEFEADGRVAWRENSEGVEDRNSLAKVVVAADGKGAGSDVSALKDSVTKYSPRTEDVGSTTEQSHFFQRLIEHVAGSTPLSRQRRQGLPGRPQVLTTALR